MNSTEVTAALIGKWVETDSDDGDHILRIPSRHGNGAYWLDDCHGEWRIALDAVFAIPATGGSWTLERARKVAAELNAVLDAAATLPAPTTGDGTDLATVR